MFDARFQTFTETSERAQGAGRVAALRQVLEGLKLAGFLVPLADEHQSEYVPESERRLAWLTGFTGSAGLAVILADKAAVFVDGRYVTQVAEQTDPAVFERHNSADLTPLAWLAKTAPANAVIGYDPALHTPAEIERFEKSLARQGMALRAVEANPIDRVWNSRPKPPSAAVTLHPVKLAGKEAAAKLTDVKTALAADKADALLVSDPHALAWLFNIRGGDVTHTPIALGYALVPVDGAATLFMDGGKLGKSEREALQRLCLLAEPVELGDKLAAFARGRTIRLDQTTAGMRFKRLIEAAGGKADLGADPIALMKARKNSVELDGTRIAHLRDGAAMARFLAWFDKTAPRGKLTEIDAVKALETFRRETKALKDVSFPTIAGANEHAALPHYRVSEESNLPIGKGIFLIDSGAQYRDGTTDITRTIAVGLPSQEMRDRFTRVLKGMIAVSLAVFPKGASGAQIDPLARQALWQAGLDFDHGTGHGVGVYLSVHEGPQRLSKLGTTPLEPGMILSNEPGYYKPGAYGIRIENLIVVEQRAIEGAERPIFGFETLTFAPIDRRLIDKALLTPTERDWLNNYHTEVVAKISPLVDAATRDWLIKACKPI
jgi:Xaa-Pro aminopeptidase